jgi:hypothetical protein
MDSITVIIGDESNAIQPTDSELNEFANFLEDGGITVNGLDEFMPLPGISREAQILLISSCRHRDIQNARYWERFDGHHGWCCGQCGTVTQWG